MCLLGLFHSFSWPCAKQGGADGWRPRGATLSWKPSGLGGSLVKLAFPENEHESLSQGRRTRAPWPKCRARPQPQEAPSACTAFGAGVAPWAPASRPLRPGALALQALRALPGRLSVRSQRCSAGSSNSPRFVCSKERRRCRLRRRSLIRQRKAEYMHMAAQQARPGPIEIRILR